MEITWRVLCFYIGLSIIELCNGLPMDLLSTKEGPNAQLIGVLVAVMVSVCVVVAFVGCVCCQRRRGFKEFRDSPVTASVVNDSTLTGDDPGHINPIASPEFTIFTPLSPPHHNNNVFRTQQPVYSYIQNESIPELQNKLNNTQIDGLDVSSWFDGTQSDFARTKLKYIRELGSGWFGRVIEGEAQGVVDHQQDVWTPCAVRILESSASAHEQALFLHEARMYKIEQPHTNVLRLWGRSLEATPLLLIQELCSKGDLKKFLLENRSCSSNPVMLGLPLQFCCQIASALQYLHDNNIPHLDLAARNCHLAADMTLRVGDYGLAVNQYPNDYYQGTPAVPVRWCAPESLNFTNTTLQPKQVTCEDNIWSFGVTMWEICEWGAQPYETLTDDEVVSQVMAAPYVRLQKPTLSIYYINPLYRLMQLCWQNIENRPQINQINSMLVHLMQVYHSDSASKSPSKQHTEFSMSDFDTRWDTFKPNTIVKTDNHILQSSQSSNIPADIHSISSIGEPYIEKSPSLTNLHGSFENLNDSKQSESFENLTEVTQLQGSFDLNESTIMDSWLQNVATDTGDMQYVRGLSQAIQALDSALASELTSSSGSSHQQSPAPESWDSVSVKTPPKIEFKLGLTPKSFTSSLNEQSDQSPDRRSLQRSESSETEDETWKKRIERGALSEKVRIKSKSVADLMVLTHIDQSDTDSETPLQSLEYKYTKNGRLALRNIETSIVFGSEGNLLAVQDTFQEELKKLQEERRDSLLFVPAYRDDTCDTVEELNIKCDALEENILNSGDINHLNLQDSNLQTVLFKDSFDNSVKQYAVIDEFIKQESKSMESFKIVPTIQTATETLQKDISSSPESSFATREHTKESDIADILKENPESVQITVLQQSFKSPESSEVLTLEHTQISNPEVKHVDTIHQKTEISHILDPSQVVTVEAIQKTADLLKLETEYSLSNLKHETTVASNEETKISSLKLNESIQQDPDTLTPNSVDLCADMPDLIFDNSNFNLLHDSIHGSELINITEASNQLESLNPATQPNIEVCLDVAKDTSLVASKELSLDSPNIYFTNLPSEDVIAQVNQESTKFNESTLTESVISRNDSLESGKRLDEVDKVLEEIEESSHVLSSLKLCSDLTEIDTQEISENITETSRNVSFQNEIVQTELSKESQDAFRNVEAPKTLKQTGQNTQFEYKINKNELENFISNEIKFSPVDKIELISTVIESLSNKETSEKCDTADNKDNLSNNEQSQINTDVIKIIIEEPTQLQNIVKEVETDTQSSNEQTQINEDVTKIFSTADEVETIIHTIEELNQLENIAKEAEITDTQSDNEQTQINQEDTKIVSSLDEIEIMIDTIEEPKQLENIVKEAEILVEDTLKNALQQIDKLQIESLETEAEKVEIEEINIKTVVLGINKPENDTNTLKEIKLIGSLIENEPDLVIEEETELLKNDQHILVEDSKLAPTNTILEVQYSSNINDNNINLINDLKIQISPVDKQETQSEIYLSEETTQLEEKEEDKYSESDILEALEIEENELNPNTIEENLFKINKQELSLVQDFINNERSIDSNDTSPNLVKSQTSPDVINTNNANILNLDSLNDVSPINQVYNVFNVTVDHHNPPINFTSPVKSLYNRTFDKDEIINDINSMLLENELKQKSDLSFVCTTSLPNEQLLNVFNNPPLVKELNEMFEIAEKNSDTNENGGKDLTGIDLETIQDITVELIETQVKNSEHSLGINDFELEDHSTGSNNELTQVDLTTTKNKDIETSDLDLTAENTSKAVFTSTPFHKKKKSTPISQNLSTDQILSFVSEGDDINNDYQTTVILGPCEDYALGLYSGLKTTFDKYSDDDRPEEELLQFSSNFMPLNNENYENNHDNSVEYSLDTWDRFLGKSFEDQKKSVFDNFTPKTKTNDLNLGNILDVEEPRSLNPNLTFEIANPNLILPNLNVENTFNDFKLNPNLTFEVSNLDHTVGIANPNLTFDLTKIEMNDDATFVLDNENKDLKDSTSEEPICSSWEPGEGWFLHPQTAPEDLKGEIDISGSDSIDNSYVGFTLDEECVNALRNELAAKLPHAQGISHEEPQEPDDWDSEERNEIIVKYNVYATPLSPIPEESCCDDVYYDQTQQRDGSDTDSDWSEPCLGRTSQLEDILVVDTETHTAQIFESPSLREPPHRHTPSQDSCCSNDTLFNLEDLNYGPNSPQNHLNLTQNTHIHELDQPELILQVELTDNETLKLSLSKESDTQINTHLDSPRNVGHMEINNTEDLRFYGGKNIDHSENDYQMKNNENSRHFDMEYTKNSGDFQTDSGDFKTNNTEYYEIKNTESSGNFESANSASFEMNKTYTKPETKLIDTQNTNVKLISPEHNIEHLSTIVPTSKATDLEFISNSSSPEIRVQHSGISSLEEMSSKEFSHNSEETKTIDLITPKEQITSPEPQESNNLEPDRTLNINDLFEMEEIHSNCSELKHTDLESPAQQIINQKPSTSETSSILEPREINSIYLQYPEIQIINQDFLDSERASSNNQELLLEPDLIESIDQQSSKLQIINQGFLTPNSLELNLDPGFNAAPLPSPEDIPWRQLPASLLTYNDVSQNDKFEIYEDPQPGSEDQREDSCKLEDELSDSVPESTDLYSNLTDIRFSGPCDTQLMSTSFSESAEFAEDRDWDSGSDTRSSSSGEFIWKEGEHEESLRALHAASHDVGVIEDIQPMDAIEEEENSNSSNDDSDDCEEDIEETEFVPSAWDSQATPTKSALRSPEKSNKRKNQQQKGVWFKKQKYHCVYEYPREPESPVAPSSDLWRPLSDFSNFSDWELDPESSVQSFDDQVMSDARDLGYDSVFNKFIARNNYPLTSGSPRLRDLYQLNSFTDLTAGMSSTDEDFFISSSARPFQALGQGSQFFPGQDTAKTKSLWNDYQTQPATQNDNITPDSGVEDVTPASSTSENGSAPAQTSPVKYTKVQTLKALAELATKKTQVKTDSLGGLRHTRNRLKLDLPPSPNSFSATRTFTIDVSSNDDPIINREMPTFTTFGKSRFSVQHVATPTEETAETFSFGPKIKNVSFEALPHKPDASKVFILDESAPEKAKHKPGVVEIVQGEASLLDSADEDSGIESSANATLERHQQQILNRIE